MQIATEWWWPSLRLAPGFITDTDHSVKRSFTLHMLKVIRWGWRKCFCGMLDKTLISGWANVHQIPRELLSERRQKTSVNEDECRSVVIHAEEVGGVMFAVSRRSPGISSLLRWAAGVSRSRSRSVRSMTPPVLFRLTRLLLLPCGVVSVLTRLQDRFFSYSFALSFLFLRFCRIVSFRGLLHGRLCSSSLAGSFVFLLFFRIMFVLALL